MIGNIGNSYTHAVAVPAAWAEADGCGVHDVVDAVTLWPALVGLASNIQQNKCPRYTLFSIVS